MSPDLFNLYSEVILRELENIEEGVVVNGVRINNLRYANNTVLIAMSEEGLQRFFDAVVTTSEHFGLSKKMKVMTISKSEPPPTCQLKLGFKNIAQVSSFNYLGVIVISDSRCRKEIRRRIGMAKDTYKRMKSIFNDRKLSLMIEFRLLKAFIWYILTYGYESCTFTADTRHNIAAAEMWFFVAYSGCRMSTG